MKKANIFAKTFELIINKKKSIFLGHFDHYIFREFHATCLKTYYTN